MLEICPPAFCAYGLRVPPRWHSHSWLCFVQRAAAAESAPATARGSASLRTADSPTFRTHIVTNLESYSCTKMFSNHIRITSLRKNIGGAPLGVIMLHWLPFSAKARRMSTYANAVRNCLRICTYDFIGLEAPLGSALAKKSQWG